MSQKKGEQMDIAKCVRIFEPEPDDDFVIKREAVIKDLRTRFLKARDHPKMMTIVSGVCEVFRDSPSIPDDLATQIEGAIKKMSPSFVQDGRDLEMGVCAAMAVVQSFNSGGKALNGLFASDVLAVALWSAASFLPPCNAPKLKDFRGLQLKPPRNRILKTSLENRDRHNVPAFGEFGDEESTCEAFKQATTSTVDASGLNAALDREEIDLLGGYWAEEVKYSNNRSYRCHQKCAPLQPESRSASLCEPYPHNLIAISPCVALMRRLCTRYRVYLRRLTKTA